MRDKIIEWISTIDEEGYFSENDYIAYNFGISENDDGFFLYLVGSNTYSEIDVLWACVPMPSEPYMYFQLSKYSFGMSWIEVLEKITKVLMDLEMGRQLDSFFLKNAKFITVGFDDDDLTRVR